MDARLQRRIQRYGWDLAVDDYTRHWHALLAGVQGELLALAAPQPGERLLDVACGAGAVTAAAAQAVGPSGSVLGIDLSQAMVHAAARHLQSLALHQASAVRMDAEQIALPDASVDVVLCALGLMYLPDPDAALREMRRVLRPGGRVVLAVWGERARCGWASVFGIVDDEVRSEVCPLFFALGRGTALARRCAAVGLEVVEQRRRADTLHHADGEAACTAALSGGPVALAWSRFDAAVRERVRARYLASLAPWRVGAEGPHGPQGPRGPGYRVPAEYLLVAARRPQVALSA